MKKGNKFITQLVKILFQFLLINLLVVPSILADELEINQVKHDFWIEFVKDGSSTDYELTQLDLLTGSINKAPSQIEVQGNLTLRSRASASLCQVKLPTFLVEALNEQSEIGQTIQLTLDGKVGDKKLTTDFTNPSFDEYNQARFLLQLFIDPASLSRGLPAGSYDYQDGLKLGIEFKEK